MTLYCGLGFLPEFCMTRETNLKINSSTDSRNAVAWFGQERPLTIPKEMGKRSVLTEHFYPCFEHCQNTRNLVGRTVLTKSSMPTIARAMKQLDSRLSFLLFGRPPRLPIDLIFGIKPASCSNYPAYVKEWHTAMKEAYEVAAKRSHLTGVKEKKHYDRRGDGLFSRDLVC